MDDLLTQIAINPLKEAPEEIAAIEILVVIINGTEIVLTHDLVLVLRGEEIPPDPTRVVFSANDPGQGPIMTVRVNPVLTADSGGQKTDWSHRY